MANLARDIVTQSIDPHVLPIAARVVDIQSDPTGGYLVLVSSDAGEQGGSVAHILKFDAAHSFLWTKPFLVADPRKAQWDLFRTIASSMSVSEKGIYVTGTTSRKPLGPSTMLFVAKLSLDASLEWTKAYEPILFNGCKIPQTANCFARDIVRLPAPDDDRLMILFHTAHKFTGTGQPTADDILGAAVLVIDDRGVAASQLTRLFGRGQTISSRLRVLPSWGPTLVGQTRMSHPKTESWSGWLARVDRDGNPTFETAYIIEDNLAINDIAEGAGRTICVSTLTDPRGGKTALAMSLNSAANILWAGNYRIPLGGEFFSSNLERIQALDKTFLLAGSHSEGAVERPWLVQIEQDSPEPIWQKRYDASEVMIPASFHSLWFPSPDLVVAGGDIPSRRGNATGKVGFLAASEVNPTVEEPGCSTPSRTSIQQPTLGQSGSSLWMDRMPLHVFDWSSASSLSGLEVRILCQTGF